MFYLCTFIIFLVSSCLHVSFSQGFLQASQFAKSSRGKPPRSHSLSERARERESVCTMARTTRLPRWPSTPLPREEKRRLQERLGRILGRGCWWFSSALLEDTLVTIEDSQFLCPLTSEKAGDRNLKPLFSLLNFLGQLFRCFCVWFPLFFDTHMTL